MLTMSLPHQEFITVGAASDDDYDDELILMKLCVLLCMYQNVPQDT